MSVHVIPILGVGLVQSNVVYERLYIHRNSCSVEREKSSVMATPSMALGTIIGGDRVRGKIDSTVYDCASFEYAKGLLIFLADELFKMGIIDACVSARTGL